MTTRYIDTAADGTGDGTTQGHTGLTSAYQSIIDWDSSESGALSEDHTVHCAGGKDSLTGAPGINLSGWSGLGTYTLSIVGDATAPDNDGEYLGAAAFSTSHYYVEGGTATTIVIAISDGSSSNGGIIIDGIQGKSIRDSSSAYIFRVEGGGQGARIRRCRLWISVRGLAWGQANSSTSDSHEFIGNHIFHDGVWGACISCFTHSAHADTLNFSHNTFYNSSQANAVGFSGGGSSRTINLYNNHVINETDQNSAFSIGDTTSTFNAHYNSCPSATAPTNHDSNWIEASATYDDDLTDADNTSPTLVDWTPVGSGVIAGGGLTGYEPATDIRDQTWDSPPSIGAIAVASAGAVRPQGPFDHPFVGPFGGPIS